MILIKYVITVILLQSTVQAKNINYHIEDYPPETTDERAVSEESLQMNEEVFYNMGGTPIVRSSFREYPKKKNNMKLSFFSSLYWIYKIAKIIYDMIKQNQADNL